MNHILTIPESVAVVAEPPQPKQIAEPLHVLPMAERVFVCRGWQILHNDIPDYETVLVKHAADGCARLGKDWIFADRPDFEALEPELIQGGHVGSFWTA